MRLHSALLILALVGLTAGCILGPGTVIRDRFDYSAAVADYALLERMRRVQLSGGIGMRVRRLESDEAGLMTFRQKVDPAIDRPADAFVAVPYRDFWFWIDDRDVPSKRMLSFIMFVFALVEPGSKDAPPVLTIPTG